MRRVDDGIVQGRRISRGLALVQSGGRSVFACRRCGAELCGARENVKAHLRMQAAPIDERWRLAGRLAGSARFELRRFWCPACASQLDVEVNLRDAPVIWSTEPIDA